MFTFQLPEIGEGVVEGEIVKWLVHEGDVISADQPVAEIMTDKATIEVTTPKSGKVMTRHGSEGDIVAEDGLYKWPGLDIKDLSCQEPGFCIVPPRPLLNVGSPGSVWQMKLPSHS